MSRIQIDKNSGLSNRPVYEVAVVAPALNEADNLRELLGEIDRAFAGTPRRHQVVIVDDGSDDATPTELAALADEFEHLVTLRHDTPLGQSAALWSGINAAESPIVCTLDADLQNDPADLPRMIDLLIQHQADLVQGDRSANRRDHVLRKIASAVGRFARWLIVSDATRDTGCGTRVMRTDTARYLPLDRPGMHRFIPACVAGFGGRVIETPVNHRPRQHGKTKYGTGILKRGLPGLRDCFVVRALIRRGQRGTEVHVRAVAVD